MFSPIFKKFLFTLKVHWFPPFLFPTLDPREAMTSIVDSEAQFNLRMEQVRVPQALRIALRNAGVNTISSLAYAHGQPGQPINAERTSLLGLGRWNLVRPLVQSRR